jgi:hypothetical protein
MSLKCPFAAPITAGRAACCNAQEVVRRGGSEYDCRSEADHAACIGLFDRLKAAALPAFGVEDDLLSMPHSTLVKIQSGGLLGLARLLGDQAAEGAEEGAEIADISVLVGLARARYGDLGLVPCAELTGDILGYRLERRGSRRRG